MRETTCMCTSKAPRHDRPKTKLVSEFDLRRVHSPYKELSAGGVSVICFECCELDLAISVQVPCSSVMVRFEELRWWLSSRRSSYKEARRDWDEPMRLGSLQGGKTSVRNFLSVVSLERLDNDHHDIH